MIMNNDDFTKMIQSSLGVLDENLDVLRDIEADLDDELKNELTPNMQLYQLYDMSEDVASTSKIKRAESNFAKRQTKDFF